MQADPEITPLSPTEYEHAMAVVTYTTLKTSIDRAFPHLADVDRDAMFTSVVDRLARLHGWAIRREFNEEEESD